MKRKIKFTLLIVFLVSAIHASAQLTEKDRMMDSTIDQARELQYENAEILRQNSNTFFAVVGDKVYDLRQSGGFITGNVKYIRDGIIMVSSGLNDIAIKNYNGTATAGRNISVVAIRSGTYDWDETPLALWDCGKPYVPLPPTPAQIAAAQEANRIVALREREKMLEGQTNAVHWLLSEATNGDASAQCSLGEHYLAGLGCETNRDLAIQWLQKAADGGSAEASNKLVQLKSP